MIAQPLILNDPPMVLRVFSRCKGLKIDVKIAWKIDLKKSLEKVLQKWCPGASCSEKWSSEGPLGTFKNHEKGGLAALGASVSFKFRFVIDL